LRIGEHVSVNTTAEIRVQDVVREIASAFERQR
jgi:hypothetical protein